MRKSKQSLLYIPTWTLLVISALFLAATIFDIYLVASLESFETITVNGIVYPKGSEGYLAGIKSMKLAFGGSAILTLLVSIVSAWLFYNRVKTR
jgi:hypothetical protein